MVGEIQPPVYNGTLHAMHSARCIVTCCCHYRCQVILSFAPDPEQGTTVTRGNTAVVTSTPIHGRVHTCILLHGPSQDPASASCFLGSSQVS